MSSIERIRRSMIAAFGALVLTATTVGAAVGPARVIETAPRSAAMQAIEQAPA